MVQYLWMGGQYYENHNLELGGKLSLLFNLASSKLPSFLIGVLFPVLSLILPLSPLLRISIIISHVTKKSKIFIYLSENTFSRAFS